MLVEDSCFRIDLIDDKHFVVLFGILIPNCGIYEGINLIAIRTASSFGLRTRVFSRSQARSG